MARHMRRTLVCFATHVDKKGAQMVSQPKDTPFGLEPNVAAGLAYLLGIIGGIVMLVGGGTNKFVKWAACQSITLGASYIALWIIVDILTMMHLGFLFLLFPIVAILYFVAWLWTWITAFQGKEVRVPVIADLTQRLFGAQVA